MMEIREKIREWYHINKRPLPWREISDPYQIWVSEIILQQTRVIQGMDYYHRFLERFPNLESLAIAKEAEVLKVWEGLGYYSRARNMQAAAKYILHERKGVFPETYKEMMKMKGVGPYTAAAVSSIAFHEPQAVVDGNVQRVISRLFGIEEVPGTYTSSSRIQAEAYSLLDQEDPGNHNQAVMELGALVCTPTSPDCSSCPLQQDCVAYLQNRIAELPLRNKPGKRRRRYFHYLVIQDREAIWIGRRTGKDIWEGLFEFPLIETTRPYSTKSLRATSEWLNLFGSTVQALQVTGPFRHILSHQEIIAKFYHLNEPPDLVLEGYKKIKLGRMDPYPLPKLILNYIKRKYS